MDNFYNKNVTTYLDNNYKITLFDIDFEGFNISGKSFKILDENNNEYLTIHEIKREVSNIYSDKDDDEDITLIANQWYERGKMRIRFDLDPKIKIIINYFKNNLNITLGTRNWETHTKSGDIFLIKNGVDDLLDLGVEWITSKILKNFYESWHSNEVIRISEKMMNII